VAVRRGIAAYKAAVIISLLRKKGAEIKCIMTAHAAEFITPLTLREISGNPVAVSLFGDVPEFRVEHIALAQWADLFVIAPATANIIGKIANGIADDLATTAVMAATVPGIIVPAMNTNMLANPIVQENMAKLEKLGYMIMPPESGVLACGTVGAGRLPEPEHIAEYIEYAVMRTDCLKGKKVIVTAGGISTKEVNSSTMESKIVRGLYLAGEVLDVHAFTGGYNLQAAFSMGRIAALSAAGDKTDA